jgi:2-methylisocitrate lyase-like PEP mutase family enzyme
MNQTEKAAAFRALHDRDEIFVIPNPWDAGSARMLASMGFAAMATTSAGLAFALGRRDGAVSRFEALANARAIIDAVDLPVSADLENGYGHTPEDAALTIRLAAEAGLVGGSIEDATGDPDKPIYEFEHAVERFTAAVEATRRFGFPFMLVGRAENFLHGVNDLDDTIRRLLAYERAGAEVLFAPGLPSLDAIREVCAAVTKPVNAVMGFKGAGQFSVAELAAAGVRRISTGGSFARAALGGLRQAADEVLHNGTFGYAEVIPTTAEINALMSSAKIR